MNKVLLLLVSALLLSVSVNAKKKEKVQDYKYELVSVNNMKSSSSSYVIAKVWSYADKKDLLTNEVCMQNAVKGILFKGLDSSGSYGGEIPALVPEGYDSHKDYFDHFFENDYMQYVQLTTKDSQGSEDVIKTANKEWKVGLTVQININALRKRLEKDGISEGAQDIFSR